ncbi:hypothetical protein KLP28_04870 [Nocardioidaceae bacterium]|nr:hypothetical protein KLP28_04870 [Nocardioidaceae bacterium]
MHEESTFAAITLQSRAALLTAGHTESELRRRRGPSGDLVVVGRGFFVERDTWATLSRGEQHRLRTAAALRRANDSTASSHGSAATMRDLATLRKSIETVHLTRPGSSTVKRCSGHLVHGGRLEDDEVTLVQGLRTTTPGRTVADIARCDGLLAGLVVADQALRSGMEPVDLAEALARQRGLPGTACFDRLLRQADAGAENPGETLARALVTEVTAALGIPSPETQFEIRGSRTAYADLRVGRLLIEFDGRWKYARDRPFGDCRPVDDVLWDEKRREDWLREQGFVVIRLTWGDVWGAGRAAARRRIHHAIVKHSGLLHAA